MLGFLDRRSKTEWSHRSDLHIPMATVKDDGIPSITAACRNTSLRAMDEEARQGGLAWWYSTEPPSNQYRAVLPHKTQPIFQCRITSHYRGLCVGRTYSYIQVYRSSRLAMTMRLTGQEIVAAALVKRSVLLRSEFRTAKRMLLTGNIPLDQSCQIVTDQCINNITALRTSTLPYIRLYPRINDQCSWPVAACPRSTQFPCPAAI